MIRVVQALFPGAVVFALAMSSFLFDMGDTFVVGLTDTYGRVVYGAGLALAWVFHRSRVFIVLACLALVDVGLTDAPDRRALLLACGSGLLVLVGALSLTRDRGLLSRGGVVQIAIAGVFVSAAAWALADSTRVTKFAAPGPWPFDLPLGPALAPATAIAVLVGAGGAAFGFYRWRGPVDRAFLWTVALLAVATYPAVGQARSGLMLMAAALTLTLAVVETSYMLAYRDDLTGLPGRRALMQYLDGINGLYTIAMVDVDHFKKFNDKHGHDVGDQVLRMVASRLGRTPGGAKAYRYGGEEFTLLFPGRTKEDALQHLEAVRETIEGSAFHLRSWRRPKKKPEPGDAPMKKSGTPKFLYVTVSIGMADDAGDDDTPEVVLKRSDQALYRAKKKGRNRVSK